MWRLDRLRRLPNLLKGVALAISISAMLSVGASALDFKCVEASRYKNLLQVFDDNPRRLASYFGYDNNQVPDFNACRALAVTGTIRDGDGAALLDNVLRNKGWLDVLYLSFDGFHLKEEVKLALIIRTFWLKTRVIETVPLRYQPDFATRWGPPAVSDHNPAEKSEPLSPLDAGLEAFARRGDLSLPVAADRNVCLESCAGAWFAGVHRRRVPVPPFDVRARPSAPDMVTARLRAALAANLDSGKVAPPNDPSWNRPVMAGATPVLPPVIDRLVRNQCSGELVAGESLEARVGGAADQLARNDFNDVRSTPPSLLSDLDSLRRAGERLQRCVARVFEHERHAAFRKFCDGGCDRAKLAATFDRMGRDFLEQQISLATMLDKSLASDQSDKFGREWQVELPAGSATWTRREETGKYEAKWPALGGKEVSATFEIGRAGNRIVAIRTQAEGRCIYQGSIAADGKTARGTFVCSWILGAYAWNAMIAE